MSYRRSPDDGQASTPAGVDRALRARGRGKGRWTGWGLGLCGLLVWAAIAGSGIWSYPLVDPDEGRNAAVARPIADGAGGWTLPEFAGLPYVDKPPLWFDAAALSMRAFGVSAGSARLPSLVFLASTVLLVAWWGKRLFGDLELAVVAAVAFAASPMVLAYSRIVLFDAMLTFFVVASLAAGYEAVEGSHPRRSALLLWLAVLLGGLTKGPVALMFPLLVSVPHGLLRKRASRLWSGPGALVWIVVLAPWLWSVEQRVPGFLRHSFLAESWERMFTDSFHHSEPWWYYGPTLLAGGLPWVLGAVAPWLARSETPPPWRRERLFLLLWLAAPLLFFSLSRSKMPHYVLPVLPAVALLVAAVWKDARMGGRARVAGGLGLVAVGAVLVASAFYSLPLDAILVERLGDRIGKTLLAMGAVFAICGLAAMAGRRRRQLGLVALAAAPMTLPLFLLPVVQVIAGYRSSEQIAQVIRETCRGAPVIGVETLPPSLAFYLTVPIGLRDDDGRALPSTYLQRAWPDLPVDTQRRLFSSTLRPLPRRAVVVFESSAWGAENRVEGLGFHRLGTGGRYVARGRGCTAPSRRLRRR